MDRRLTGRSYGALENYPSIYYKQVAPKELNLEPERRINLIPKSLKNIDRTIEKRI